MQLDSLDRYSAGENQNCAFDAVLENLALNTIKVDFWWFSGAQKFSKPHLPNCSENKSYLVPEDFLLALGKYSLELDILWFRMSLKSAVLVLSWSTS